MRIPPGTEVYFGAPAEPPPDAFLQAIANQLRSTPQVLSAFLFNLVIGKGNAQTMVGLITDLQWSAEDFGALMAKIQGVAHNALAEGTCVDFVRLDAAHPLAKALLGAMRPFYLRESSSVSP